MREHPTLAPALRGERRAVRNLEVTWGAAVGLLPSGAAVSQVASSPRELAETAVSGNEIESDPRRNPG
jgi:hypothetical protein